jgi:hypothetical protein
MRDDVTSGSSTVVSANVQASPSRVKAQCTPRCAYDVTPPTCRRAHRGRRLLVAADPLVDLDSVGAVRQARSRSPEASAEPAERGPSGSASPARLTIAASRPYGCIRPRLSPTAGAIACGFPGFRCGARPSSFGPRRGTAEAAPGEAARDRTATCTADIDGPIPLGRSV